MSLVRKCKSCFTERKHKFKFNNKTLGRWYKYIQGQKQKFKATSANFVMLPLLLSLNKEY